MYLDLSSCTGCRACETSPVRSGTSCPPFNRSAPFPVWTRAGRTLRGHLEESEVRRAPDRPRVNRCGCSTPDCLQALAWTRPAWRLAPPAPSCAGSPPARWWSQESRLRREPRLRERLPLSASSSSTASTATAAKCTVLCNDRLESGLAPGCAQKACPTELHPVRRARRAAGTGPQAVGGVSFRAGGRTAGQHLWRK